ncbi:MAG: aminoacyl-tRNA hydrolase [Candidatus Eremiobacteraeota bacterium]|nr:aminoacyl-tRNA hydrolase [Candidatus Eremiobacteraeota bacterium]
MGLGNPGRSYARTRHNIGFRVLETLAEKHAAPPWRTRFHARVTQFGDLSALLAMPQTYMNASGESVADMVAYHKVAMKNVFVVVDDANLPFGRLRLRRSGSDGGHNGLKSVIEMLGSTAFPRLRCGIGRQDGDLIDHVITAFSKAEERALPEIIDRCVAGIETFLDAGVEAAIALINAAGGDAPASG